MRIEVSQSHFHDAPHPNLTSLSGCSTGRSCVSKDSSFTLLNLPDNRVKRIVGERSLSGYSFLAVEQRITSSKEFELKTIRMTVSAVHAL